MKRFKAALKAAKIPSIIGLVLFVVGIVFAVVALVAHVDALFWVGVVLFLWGICAFVIAVANYKQRLHAICPECEKFMGDTTQTVHYSYQCTDYKDNYGSDGKYRNTSFHYTCTIDCPHCGSTHTFDYKVDAKSQAQANVQMSNYLKNTLKLKDKESK